MAPDTSRSWTLALCLALTAGCASAHGSPVVIGESLVLRSAALGEDRPLMVHLPDGYATERDRRWPVLYVLDGETAFTRAVGTLDWLAKGATLDGIPDHIVVAIPNVDDSRGRDFSYDSDTGGAARFTDFIENELVPWVDRSYRTRPYRILHGHSATGSYALYVMMTRPELFNAYIVASGDWPGWADGIGSRVFEGFRPRDDLSTFLFSLRGDELPNTVARYDRWIDLLGSEGPSGLTWQSRIDASEVHMTTPGVALHYGLRALYADAHPDAVTPIGERGLRAVVDYFERLSAEKYGYAFLPEAPVARLASVYAGRGEYETAIGFTRLLIDAYPASTDNYRTMALWQERAGRLEEAGSWLRRGMALADRDPGYTRRFLMDAQKKRLEEALAQP